MIFITGPLFAGKRQAAMGLLGWSREELEKKAVWDVQDLAPNAEDLEALARRLSDYPVVIATEVGGGVVPADPAERAAREAAGRLSCLLAQRAQTVVRVFCGIPTVLKGALGRECICCVMGARPITMSNAIRACGTSRSLRWERRSCGLWKRHRRPSTSRR